jgi:hypothetical protein
VGRFGDEAELGHQFAAAAEVTSDSHAPKVWLRPLKGFLRMVEQGGRTMQMEPALAAPGDRQVLQDLGLQGSAEALSLFEAVVFRGCFDSARVDAQVLIEPQHLVGPKPWYR